MRLGWVSSLFACAVIVQAAEAIEKIAPHLSVVSGPVNGVLLERDGKTIAIYGDPRPKPARVSTVFFTHHRRDVVWAGRALVAQGAQAVAPEAEKDKFTGVAEFWEPLPHGALPRLREPIQPHSCRASPANPHRARRRHRGRRRGYRYARIYAGRRVLPHQIDGKRIACTGDLIYGDGRILDLYSLQDAIPQPKEDGYHGYAARAGDVVASLRKNRRLETRYAHTRHVVPSSATPAKPSRPSSSVCRQCSPATSPLMRCAGIAETKRSAQWPRVCWAMRPSTGCPWPKRCRKSCPIGSSRSPTRVSSSPARVRHSWSTAVTSASWTRWRGLSGRHDQAA